MKTADEIMGLVDRAYHLGQIYWKQAYSDSWSENKKSEATVAKWLATKDEIRAALTALASGECSVAGLADDLRLVAQLESKRMGAMSSGLLKGVIDRLSALPPPPAEGTVA